ncbi:hypothetical protein ACWGE0_14710 [Lentzea sp. NPDC054927]
MQPRSGRKTHGRWFTDAEQHLLGMGIPGTPVTAADVEIKIAVHGRFMTKTYTGGAAASWS